MEKAVARWTLGELAAQFGADLDGPGDHPVERPVPADSDDPLGICFAESKTFFAQARDSGVGAVILAPEMPAPGKPALRHPNPRLAFFGLLRAVWRPSPLDAGVHPASIVHPDAVLDSSASVGAYAVIERGARVGPGCRIHPHAYVGEGCHLGEGCEVYPHATLVQDVRLGARCLVHPGAVLGADGFGYFWDGQRRVKIPQVGGVLLGDDVEIGALTTVDRAMCGDTIVGDGVKLDNLVMIAHNVRVGDHTVMAAQTGIAGSSRIGARCVFGGQAAMPDHAEVVDDVVLAGRSAVMSRIDAPGEYFGLPAIPIREAHRRAVAVAKIPELTKRVKALERELAELRAALGQSES